MRISPIKSGWIQPPLFDPGILLRGSGHVRTIVGETVERLTLELTGGRRHRTSGRLGDYCPDVSLIAGERVQYLECKAAGRNRETFVYSGRLEKDRAFVAGGRSLAYLIWHHRAETKTVDTVEALRALIFAELRAVYLVPFPELDRIAMSCPVEPLNSGYGKKPGCATANRVYGSGYRIRLRSLEPFRIMTFTAGVDRSDWPRSGFIWEKIPNNT
jgi:hypothetical protein